MSRSNPQVLNPNPATKWFEWNGETGAFRYYDKEAKKTVPVPLPFTFLLLDELAVVRGWHEPSESGITSNEVRDTRSEPFVVKSFKGGKIAEGFWSQIRDRVGNEGGRFNANLYIAYKETMNGQSELKIGSLMLHGTALSSYFDWRKEEGNDKENVGGKLVPVRYVHGIAVKKFAEGKQGKVVYRYPVFEITPTHEKTDEAAAELDKDLQKYLDGYFKRTRVEQVESPVTNGEEPQDDAPDDAPMAKEMTRAPAREEDDDVPF